ncbi:Methyltransferase [Patulibacter medicamentivorans]|uniref:Methyltransferase n=1 Tax=Patulibacter medicamentivorans TaxID=1097667 RepID=H0E7A2_9ACTN|nr:TylF/MycF/NovP-related O-methyltransferase [Patulibacter medicamentivorans]EHN10427.1 Methyltransferase [Patulibacter medicamentivorans]
MSWDLRVYPDSQIARLPRPLRPLALVARNLVPSGSRAFRYAYRSVDLATSNRSPFLDDPAFEDAYRRVSDGWYDGDVDVRWRVWTLARLARTRRGLPAHAPGAFAEFGVYRGGCAFIILSTAELPASQRYFLFDTFSGVPDDRLEASERRMGIAGEWADTSAEAVAQRLAPWSGQIEIRPGDLFETLPATETGPLSFVHIDLNASAPTIAALEYAHPRMQPGAIVVFDDYGSPRYDEQRQRIDDFFADVPEDLVVLATGQAFAIKR